MAQSLNNTAFKKFLVDIYLWVPTEFKSSTFIFNDVSWQITCGHKVIWWPISAEHPDLHLVLSDLGAPGIACS